MVIIKYTYILLLLVKLINSLMMVTFAGSCWAFTTVAAVEGINKIVSGNLISLSEQQLVDCNTRNSGCKGGDLRVALEYVIKNGGIQTEKDYPYVMRQALCKRRKVMI